MITHLKAFASGFISTLVFHQGLLGLFYLAGIIPRAPYNLNPVGFLSVPSVVSLSFFGGLWGIIIWKMISRSIGVRHWVKSFVLGALGPTAVAFLIVFPLKGIEVNLAMIPFGLLLNGVWGVGVSIFMKLLNRLK
ncbi:hypothetical protein [Halobacteriovorax sp.]|uniref:hypothetical protein n=1 Tax=Halobacteriovorax sp. TaxID=2020862 RepID=UPI003564E2C2